MGEKGVRSSLSGCELLMNADTPTTARLNENRQLQPKEQRTSFLGCFLVEGKPSMRCTEAPVP